MKRIMRVVSKETTNDFLETLKLVEKEKCPSGGTWGELLKSAKLEGVKSKVEGDAE